MDGTSQAQALTVGSDKKNMINDQLEYPPSTAARVPTTMPQQQQQQQQQPSAVRTSGAVAQFQPTSSGYPVPPYEQGGQNVYYHPHRRFHMQNGGVPPHMPHVRGPQPPHSFAAAHHDRMAAMHRNMATAGGEYSMMMPPYAVESAYGMPPSYPPPPPPPPPPPVSPPTTAQPTQQVQEPTKNSRSASIVSPTAQPADVVVVEEGSSASLSPGGAANLAAAKKRRLAPANESFPQKLHKILSDPQYRDLICWLPHGRAWRVLKPKSFEEKVIPHFFRSERYASFMRQVNGWGFKRITEGLDANSYFHEQFLRGLPDVCSKMVRPQKGQATSSCRDLGECPDFYKISQFAPLPEDDGEGQVAAAAPMPSPIPMAPPHAPSMVPNSNPAISSAAPAPVIGMSTSPPLMMGTTVVGQQVGPNTSTARRVSVVASSVPPRAPQTYTAAAPSPSFGVPSPAPVAESMEPVLPVNINNAYVSGDGGMGGNAATDETATSAAAAVDAQNSWPDADDWLSIPMFSPLTPLSPRPVYQKSQINGAPPVPQLPLRAQPTPQPAHQQPQPTQVQQQPQQQMMQPQPQQPPPPPPSQPSSTGVGGARGLSEADLAYLTQQNRILLDQARRLQIDRSC